MDCIKFLLLILACAWVETVLGAVTTPWIADQQLSHALFISFPISQGAIAKEIEQRTSEGNACDNIVRSQLLDLANTTVDPVIEMFIHISPTSTKENNDVSIPMDTLMMFFVNFGEYSLGLNYFISKKDKAELPDSPFTVDEITVSDDYTLITVIKGDDRLRIALDWSLGDCESPKTMHHYTSSKFYESWYPFNFDTICTDSFCQSPLLDPHLCGIHRAGGDVCYANKLEGSSCKFNATISEMTGVFQERSLLTADTPLSSSVSYYFEGIRKLGFSYPCINHRQVCH